MENHLQLIIDRNHRQLIPDNFDHQALMEDDQRVSLAIMATATDVRDAVQYLKRKPEGLTSVEALDAPGRRIFDPRKVIAYELWGILFKIDNRLKLTPLGWDLARSLTPEVQIFRSMISSIRPYQMVLECIFQNQLAVVTYLDALEYWLEHYPETLDKGDEKKLEASVLSFFHLCHAADLGVLTLGRKGQPARLRIHQEELSAFILSEKRSVAFDAPQDTRRPERTKTASVGSGVLQIAPMSTSKKLRLLISHNSKPNIAHFLEEMLGLIGIESDIIERQSSRSLPLPENTIRAMRRCAAALIIVSGEDFSENQQGDVSINPGVLVEIGAALVHFDHRVELLWDQQEPLPASLSGLSCSGFEGESLTSLEMGLRLIKTVKGFEQSFQPGT
jgi:hypothetical protein